MAHFNLFPDQSKRGGLRNFRAQSFGALNALEKPDRRVINRRAQGPQLSDRRKSWGEAGPQLLWSRTLPGRLSAVVTKGGASLCRSRGGASPGVPLPPTPEEGSLTAGLGLTSLTLRVAEHPGSGASNAQEGDVATGADERDAQKGAGFS